MRCATCARAIIGRYDAVAICFAGPNEIAGPAYCSEPCYNFGMNPEHFFGLDGAVATWPGDIALDLGDPWNIGDIGWP